MPLVRRQALLILYGGLAALLSAAYFLHYPIPGLLARLREAVSVLLFALIALGTGLKLFRRFRLDASVSGELLWSFGLGVPLFSLSLLALGLAGFFRPIVFLSVAAAAAIVCRQELSRIVLEIPPLVRKLFGLNFNFSSALLLGAAAAVSGTAILCAFSPPTYYDSLVYHLALPAKYLMRGRIDFVPFNHYSHFPQNMELIFGWFLGLSGDVSAQLFCVLLAAMTAAAIWYFGRTHLNMDGFRWDLLLFISAPCVILLSSETYVEIGMAFWTTLSVIAGLEGIRRSDRRWLLLSGLLAGYATGIKYTGILTPAILCLQILIWPRERSWRQRAADVLVIGGSAAAVFLPWMAKNAWLTGGNPVFPFLPGLFPAKNVFMSKESAGAYFQVLQEYGGTSPLLVEIFMMPFRLATRATSFGGGFDVTGDLGWIFPILLLPAVFFSVKDHPFRAMVLFYLAGHALIWASLRPVLRFLFPVFPLLCLAAGWGWKELIERLPRPGRWTVGLLAAGFILSNAVLFYWVERVRDPFPEAFGFMDRDSYLRRKIDSYAALSYLNANLPMDSNVLMIGDQRGYYLRRHYLAPMALLPTPLKGWADGSPDGEGLRKKLVESGYTHLFFNRREAERLKGYGVLDLTERGRAVWEDMLGRLPRFWDSGDILVFPLVGEHHG